MLDGEDVGPRARVGSRARVGPNAAVQLAAEICARDGRPVAADLFEAAGAGALWRDPPNEMIDERSAAALFAAVRARWDAEEADARLFAAGRRTGAYVAKNRVPAPVRFGLSRAPGVVSGPLLLKAIAANAWTFAGSGVCSVASRPVWRVEILDNPIATPGCPWHRGVFEELFRRVAGLAVSVAHRERQEGVRRICRFEIVRAQSAIRRSGPGYPENRATSKQVRPGWRTQVSRSRSRARSREADPVIRKIARPANKLDRVGERK